MKSKYDLPRNILVETYRPLAFFAGEALLAAAPFLPGVIRAWAQQLMRLDETRSRPLDAPPPGP